MTRYTMDRQIAMCRSTPYVTVPKTSSVRWREKVVRISSLRQGSGQEIAEIFRMLYLQQNIC